MQSGEGFLTVIPIGKTAESWKLPAASLICGGQLDPYAGVNAYFFVYGGAGFGGEVG